MSILYKVDSNIAIRLWKEWLWPTEPSDAARLHFDNWMREVRVPYADDVNVRTFPDDSEIIFKEEKDLTFFLLTL